MFHFFVAGDTFKGHGLQGTADVKSILEGMYLYYRDSPRAVRQIKEIAIMMEEEFYRPVTLKGTRWTAHYHRALTNLLASIGVVHAHLHNEAATSSGSVTMQGRARNIVRQMESFFTLGYMHLILDVYEVLMRTSCLFQKNDITLAGVKDGLESACLRCLAMVTRPGEKLQAFFTEVGDGSTFKGIQLRRTPEMENRLTTIRRELCEGMVDFINSRFLPLQENPQLSAADVFDVRCFPSAGVQRGLQQDVAEYGHDEIEQLVNHYRRPLEAHGADLDQMQDEWVELKVLMVRHRDLTNQGFWERIFRQHQGDLPNILLLAEIVLILPMCTACCERGFSAVKRIKNDWRSCLAVNVLDHLLRITLEGPTVDDFEPEKAIQHWWESGEHSRRPGFMPFAIPGAD